MVRRFTSLDAVDAWSDLIESPDCERWTELMATSCSNQNPVFASLRLRRFDNATRIFVVRAEPRYNSDGVFVCHLVSGLDVTDLETSGGRPISCEQSTRDAASEWHSQLVPLVTVVSACADIIPDLLGADVDPMLLAVSGKLTSAAQSLRHRLMTLNAVVRSQDSHD